MSDTNSEWRSNGFMDEDDEFDKTVSAFSGQPIPKKKESVEEEVLTAAFEEEEEDDFDKTVSAFAERHPVPVQKKTTAVAQKTAKKENSFWNTLKGKAIKFGCILVPLLVIGLLVGPGAIIIWPIAIWLVFWKLR